MSRTILALMMFAVVFQVVLGIACDGVSVHYTESPIQTDAGTGIDRSLSLSRRKP